MRSGGREQGIPRHEAVSVSRLERSGQAVGSSTGLGVGEETRREATRSSVGVCCCFFVCVCFSIFVLF